ncbi:MAG: hypothetical protein AAB442_02635 [Patescibacteria group bacterium]
MDLRIAGHIPVSPTAEKTTLTCFDQVASRDADIDRWLPIMQPATPLTLVTVFAWDDGEKWNDRNAAAALLGLGRGDRLTERALGTLLIALGHTLTLSQVEAVLAHLEETGPAQVIRDLSGSFSLHCFTPTGDPKRPVALFCVQYWWDDGVRTHVFHAFENEFGTANLLLVPNFVRRH